MCAARSLRQYVLNARQLLLDCKFEATQCILAPYACPTLNKPPHRVSLAGRLRAASQLWPPYRTASLPCAGSALCRFSDSGSSR